MSSRYLILAVSAALIGTLAACESPSPAPSRPGDVPSRGSVDHQQREIEARMEQNFRAGRLTQDEYRALRSAADDIRREERRFMSDGTLSPNEKQLLQSRLEGLSRQVDRQSSDAQRR